jgi:hypothetical protein
MPKNKQQNHEDKQQNADVKRTATGRFALGSARPAGSGPRPGQKLRKLDLIIAEMEVRLNRNCDPVVTLLELAAGHDELADKRLQGFKEKEIAKVLMLPGWRGMVYDQLLKAGIDPEIVIALREREVPRDVRADAAKAAARFVRPILAQTEVSGPEGGPIQTANFPAAELMGSDKLAALVEEMQIALANKVQQSRLLEEEQSGEDTLED